MSVKAKAGILAAAIIALNGCFGGYSPNASFYTLSTPKTVSVISNKVLDIQIERVEMADYLQQPQIVTLDTNRVELVKSEFNRWGAPLASIVQNTLAADMSKYLPASEVNTVGSIYTPTEYNVRVRISRLEGTWNEQAVIEAWWQVLNKKGNIIINRRSYFETPLTTGYVELAEKQSLLVNQLAEEIAKAISGK